MQELNEKLILDSFVNASKREIADITFPANFETIDWDTQDFFGWRDPKLPKRAYAVIPQGDAAIAAVLLTRSSNDANTRAQCSWCQDVNLPNPVILYGAKRPKRVKSTYSSIAALVCEDFQCSRNARTVIPMDYEGFDPGLIRENQIKKLRERSAAFVARLLQQ
jgi:hypothetical protein